MDIVFKKVEMKDRELINRYLAQQKTRSCEMTFANIYLWSVYYKVDYAIVEDMLIFRGSEDRVFFDYPVGKEEGVKPAIDALLEYCRERGQRFILGLVTPEKFARLEELYPGMFEISYDRDAADYVYETEKLANLSGKSIMERRTILTNSSGCTRSGSMNRSTIPMWRTASRWRSHGGA